MAAARIIQAACEQQERRYEAAGLVPPEHLSLAASAAMHSADRHAFGPGAYTRADVRRFLSYIDPDEIMDAATVAGLQKLAR